MLMAAVSSIKRHMGSDYKVDIDGEDVAKTAKDFLKENGIID